MKNLIVSIVYCAIAAMWTLPVNLCYTIAKESGQKYFYKPGEIREELVEVRNQLYDPFKGIEKNTSSTQRDSLAIREKDLSTEREKDLSTEREKDLSTELQKIEREKGQNLIDFVFFSSMTVLGVIGYGGLGYGVGCEVLEYVRNRREKK